MVYTEWLCLLWETLSLVKSCVTIIISTHITWILRYIDINEVFVKKNNPKKTRKTNCNLQLTLMFWSDNSFLKEDRHIFLHIMVILKFYTEMEFMWLFFWRIINMRFLRFCTKYHVSMLYCLMHFNIIFNLFFSFPQNTTLLTV